jgi:choline monooxygenase
MFSCFLSHLQLWSVWPVSLSETVLTAWGIVGPTPEGTTEEKWRTRNERDWQHFMNVTAEDLQVINAWGTVVNSIGYGRNLFNTTEGRLTAFHAEVNKRPGSV